MLTLFTSNKENKLKGKWIHLSHISPLLQLYSSIFSVNKIGTSHLKKPIHSLTLGNGKLKILMWTQMHGNEATATKVVFDLLKLFNSPNCPPYIMEILEKCTLKIIPILNPDGAEAYTRVNAQQIDLNRDAVALQAPESKILRQELENFNPNFCFNLHDQRNIYNVKGTKEPSSVAFLAPVTEVSRKMTPERKKAMGVICKMYEALKSDIPNNLARYNDEFYPNATGDNFQKDGYCTILIEAGHYKDDYDRETVRYFYFKSLITGLLSIAHRDFGTVKMYVKIPKNDNKYLDIIYTNVNIKEGEGYKNVSVGIVMKEFIDKNGHFKRVPIVETIGDLNLFGANTIHDAKGLKIEVLNKLPSILSQIN